MTKNLIYFFFVFLKKMCKACEEVELISIFTLLHDILYNIELKMIKPLNLDRNHGQHAN